MTKQLQKAVHVVLVKEEERDDAFLKYRDDLQRRTNKSTVDWPRKVMESSSELWLFITPDEAFKLRGLRITSFCQVGKVYEHERFTDIIQVLIAQSW